MVKEIAIFLHAHIFLYSAIFCIPNFVFLKKIPEGLRKAEPLEMYS